MRDDAVSPVVGVMLMLTVTIILAAVFAAAAGSVFSKDAEPVNAELVYVKEDAGKYIFEMKSGEPFTLSALKIVYTTPDNTEKHASFSLDGGGIRVGERFSVTKPGFSGSVIYQFYHVDSGLLVSSGEIRVP